MSWTRFVFTLTSLTALMVPTSFDTVLAAQQNPYRGAPPSASVTARVASSTQTLPLKFATVKDYNTGTSDDGLVAVGDLRGNGYADLVIASCTSTPQIDVLLGNGDGTFNAPTYYGSGGSCPMSIAIADVNGDGYADLVVANLYQNAFSDGGVSVFLGNGTGTFGAPVNYDSGGSGAQSVAVADVNGDGYPDLVIANQFGSSGSGDGVVAVLLGDGHGSFHAPVSYGAGGVLSDSVAVGDFNGDGHPDIVVASKCQSGDNCNSAGVLGVLLNKGDGTFAVPVIYGAGGFMYALSVVTGDLNGDGHLDLVVGNWCQKIDCTGGVAGGVSVLLGKGNGSFQPAVTYSSGSGPAASIALGDLNGDGHPDVLVNGGLSVDGSQFAVDVLLGNGNGTLEAPVGVATGGFSSVGVAIADVNRDGRPDLVASFDGQRLDVFLNQLREPSTIAVKSSLNPSIINQPVTFSATVTSPSPVPNGSPVIFYANSIEIGSGVTKNGVAKITKVLTQAKTYAIEASYAGDPFHGKSVGYVTGGQKVTLYPSTTTLTSNPNPSTVGQAVTLTATVSSSAPGGPTGWVTFLNGTTSLGTVKLSSGTATLITTKLPVGILTLTANYNGDTQSAKSSGITSQAVN